MNQSSQDLLQQQYDSLPYPKIPLEKSPAKDYDSLFANDLTTSYYLCHQRVIDTKKQVILDVGCGSGWTTLNLAFANPNAKIIAIDLSQNSLDVAKKRLEYHQFNDVEFHPILIENIAELNYQYDYINCEDVLCLLDEPLDALKTFKSVLKPDGIIHTDFHNYYQRFVYYTSQELFRCLGLLEENPDDFEINVVVETMKNLKPNVLLKQKVGGLFNQENIDIKSDKVRQAILMNHLLQNDKGYTIPKVFEMLRESKLKFLSMVNWRQWEIRDLFQENNLPTVWEFALENASEEEKLHFYELLHPCHRIIDFWCSHDEISSSFQPPSTWEENDWQKAKIYLHPQLKLPEVKQDLLIAIKQQNPWEVSKFIKLPTTMPIYLSAGLAAVLLILWEKPATLAELVSYYLKIQPIDLVTGEEKNYSEAEKEIIDLVVKLETFLYLLVEKI